MADRMSIALSGGLSLKFSASSHFHGTSLCLHLCSSLFSPPSTCGFPAVRCSRSIRVSKLYHYSPRVYLSSRSVRPTSLLCLRHTNQSPAPRFTPVLAMAETNPTRSEISADFRTPEEKNDVAVIAKLDQQHVVHEDPVVGKRRMKGAHVNAVFFDLDDTLVLTHAADKVAQKAVQALVERKVQDVKGDEILKVFVRGFDLQPWDPTHQVDVTEWRARLWGKALESQGIEDMELARDMQSCFDRERMLSFQWAPGVEAMVRSLHAQGIKVGIITNGHFTVQRTKLKACQANELFDTILIGGEEPNEKPHKDIFLKACKLAKCKPEESVMVGDNLKTDIQGGINAGFLGTVWVNVHNLEGLPSGGAQPTHIIPSISDLPTLLQEWTAE